MNIQQMMKQAQSMQKKMQELQKTMEETNFTGTSGGGMVTITATGKGEIKKVQIDKSLLVPDEVEVLEDLIVAAFNNAKHNSDQYSNDAINKLGISPNLLKGMI
ncbi:YbaB/EbfC family nucleoid-associated protein [Candidatus Bandiella euplotis]|uniref:Nucleoid-associated protein Bandiella_00588 n=1 Tax=Candidatus Bandiella euplotis TaxID=1664265 RepID=A0ABZ0UK39_9RICK|nr:YbaB/EbfC family nucleoid-associated protein [Candidatus Bandiella woodruffii]WPX96474.1 YbaB/EbfC family nucleoid-associated protein [Candidatus Bandiella woodruffii]